MNGEWNMEGGLIISIVSMWCFLILPWIHGAIQTTSPHGAICSMSPLGDGDTRRRVVEGYLVEKAT
jgi:hypothetical protein